MNQMQVNQLQQQPGRYQGQPVPGGSGLPVPGKAIIGLLFLVALFAFEIFNFDTTRYALANLLGDVSFAGLRWATILAIAFCSIDFAGLLRFFMPDEDGSTPKEVWYLMGAWMLGATMNAIMTWWAVALTLINHDLGNEVLGRQELLQIVPVFVAALVWLTRILFIGSFTVAGGYLFDLGQKRPSTATHAKTATAQPGREVPVFLRRQEKPAQRPEAPARRSPRPQEEGKRQRPLPGRAPQTPVPMQAQGRKE